MCARQAGQPESHIAYSLNITTDSTQVPDRLLLCDNLSFPSRVLAGVILYHQKSGESPTVTRLAADLSVDKRTIERWLEELREANVLAINRTGRTNIYSFLMPRRSRIGDRRITYSEGQNKAIGSAKVREPARRTAQVAHGGGGGSDSFEDSDPPPSTTARRARRIRPEDITEETGRWMVREGFSLRKAYQLQHLPLRSCQEDHARRRQLGQGLGAIALAWEVEPPAPAPIDLAGESTDEPETPYTPPPAARSIEDAQARWETRAGTKGRRL